MDDKDIINKLSDKVDSHERSLVLISKAVEDINKNLERFATSNEKLTTDMVKHWYAQDAIMTKIEGLLSSMSAYEQRFQKVEERQISGCPNFLNFKEKREGELAAWERRASSLETAAKRSREEIQEMQSKCAVTIEQIKVANNRIKDLEDDKKKGMWMIVTAFVGILVSLIQGFRG